MVTREDVLKLLDNLPTQNEARGFNQWSAQALTVEHPKAKVWLGDLKTYATDVLGFKFVSKKPTGSNITDQTAGATYVRDKEIWLSNKLSPTNKFKTLAHELAHVLRAELMGEDAQQLERALLGPTHSEVFAEATSAMVTQTLGLGTMRYSQLYLSLFGLKDEPEALTLQADAIADSANTLLAHILHR